MGFYGVQRSHSLKGFKGWDKGFSGFRGLGFRGLGVWGFRV